MKKHFTATAYIVAKIDGKYKVLLHKHKKHKLWIGIGGHIEKDENPTEALIREVKEETSLDIQFLSKNKLLVLDDAEELVCPDVVLQEKLSSFEKEPSHYHIDLIYFTFCRKPENIKMQEEYGWFSEEDLKNKTLEKEVKYITQKIFKLLP